MSNKPFSFYYFEGRKANPNGVFSLIANATTFGFSNAEEVFSSNEYCDMRLSWTTEHIVPHLLIRGKAEENAVMYIEKMAYIRISWRTRLVICIDIGQKWPVLLKMLKNYCSLSLIEKCEFAMEQLFSFQNRVASLLQTVQKIRINDIAIETIPCASLEIKECNLNDLQSFLAGTKSYIDRITLFFSHTEFSQIRLQKSGKIILISRNEWDRESSLSFIEDFIDKSKILEI